MIDALLCPDVEPPSLLLFIHMLQTQHQKDDNTITTISPPKCRSKSPGGWGVLSFPRTYTRTSKRTLQEGLILLQRLGKEKMLVIMLSHPGGTAEALDAVERYCGFAINRLSQYLRRHLAKPQLNATRVLLF